jgi:hypothetical protein
LESSLKTKSARREVAVVVQERTWHKTYRSPDEGSKASLVLKGLIKRVVRDCVQVQNECLEDIRNGGATFAFENTYRLFETPQIDNPAITSTKAIAPITVALPANGRSICIKGSMANPTDTDVIVTRRSRFANQSRMECVPNKPTET